DLRVLRLGRALSAPRQVRRFPPGEAGSVQDGTGPYIRSRPEGRARADTARASGRAGRTVCGAAEWSARYRQHVPRADVGCGRRGRLTQLLGEGSGPFAGPVDCLQWPAGRPAGRLNRRPPNTTIAYRPAGRNARTDSRTRI